MIDWGAYLDDLAYCLSTQYEVEDRMALEILLSALVDCPHTAPLYGWCSRPTTTTAIAQGAGFRSARAGWWICSEGSGQNVRIERSAAK